MPVPAPEPDFERWKTISFPFGDQSGLIAPALSGFFVTFFSPVPVTLIV